MDIRDAKFYVINEEAGNGDAEPLDFDSAFQKADALVSTAHRSQFERHD